jgi:shikimate dehydrogenase
VEIDTGTKIVGLIGHPISHSFSPFIHNTAFEILNLNFKYLVFDVPPENLKEAIRGIPALGIIGVNITIPHKEAVLELLDNVSPETRIIGAVNTIVNENGNLTGYNTDVFGFTEPLKRFKNEVANSPVLIFGAGGAARAVIYSLITNFQPEKIIISNRNLSRAQLLVEHFSQILGYREFEVRELFIPDMESDVKSARLIINATPIGMYPKSDETLIQNPELFHKGQIIYDVVYNPQETVMLKIAKSRGARIISGIDMLIFQAAKSFELWTGFDMPLSEIRKMLIQKIRKKKRRRNVASG